MLDFEVVDVLLELELVVETFEYSLDNQNFYSLENAYNILLQRNAGTYVFYARMIDEEKSKNYYIENNGRLKM